MKIFSGSSNQALAQKVAKVMEMPVSSVEVFVFPDGERRIQIQEDVVDEETVVVQSTNTPVDTHYIELFFIIDGLLRSGAKSVTLVMPYMGYQRQDHVFRDGEAVSLDVVVKLLEALKVDRVITFDPHTIKLREFFQTDVVDLSALSLFAQFIKEKGWDAKDTVLVSPDMGGLRRIKKMSSMLSNMNWIATVKDRDLDTGGILINRFEGPLPVAELKDKRALMVDDMISSGKTISECASFLKSNGVKEIQVFATHPIFSKDAPRLLQVSNADMVYVSDSVWIPEEKRFEKLKILSIAEMIAGELRKINQ